MKSANVHIQIQTPHTTICVCITKNKIDNMQAPGTSFFFFFNMAHVFMFS